MPVPLPLGDVMPAGDLRRRAALNFSRLHDDPFRFEAMIRANTAAEAPGDWIGRAMLGLSVLGQVLQTEPHYLEEIMAKLPSALNARGYIGLLHAAGTADENQVGGHNGLLRGLCEYYLWKRDPRALAVIRSVVTNLMLPTRDLYAAYPDEKLAKLADGRPIGLTVKNEGVWVGLSTDIGTVFFTLDALTQVYTIEPSPELRGLIETMIARYARLDVRKIGAQTHSTLSTLRGIFRWWEEVDPRPELLALVRECYRLYREHAETEHYANYNWFGRPRVDGGLRGGGLVPARGAALAGDRRRGSAAGGAPDLFQRALLRPAAQRRVWLRPVRRRRRPRVTGRRTRRSSRRRGAARCAGRRAWRARRSSTS
jgi:hypothetical protein